MTTARRALLAALCLSVLFPFSARAQDEAPIQPRGPEHPELDSAPNTNAGEFTPAKGFDLITTKFGSLNLSFYGLVRYINQLPPELTYTDHLGRERPVKERNDLNWHRTMIWFSGFALDPRLKYVFTVWSLPTTQQTLAFGNLQFTFSKLATLGAGIGPTLTARSMQGSHPLWLSSDRQMGEEFFRGGFSSAAWLRGEILPRLNYYLSLNTNLSQLGVTAANDSRDFVYSASLTWLPTTGEYGLRGGVADFDEHEKLATRFGASAAHGREFRAAEITEAPNATQIRLSDGVLAFEEGALAPGVTIQNLDYNVLAIDSGLKYRGFTFEAEYFFRLLNNFLADGTPPVNSILDHGGFTKLMYMAIPQRLGVYFSGTYVFDQFGRRPWELSGGASWFPAASQSWRVNLHYIRVERSPTGSFFGFYTAGQSGQTISLGTDVLF